MRRADLEMLACSVWRSSLILSFASCYIMWGKFFGAPTLLDRFHQTWSELGHSR